MNIKEIDDAIRVMDTIRTDAQKDSKYGFSDDWKNFMKKMRLLTTQSSGSRMQDYIFNKFGWTKIPSNLNRGDVKNNLGQFFEVKVSTITPSNRTANFVQIRLFQNISGYHIFVIDSTTDYKLIHFSLSKSEMKKEVELCGSQAHGTKESIKSNNNIEYAIHIKWKKEDETFNRWIENYKQDTDLSKN